GRGGVVVSIALLPLSYSKCSQVWRAPAIRKTYIGAFADNRGTRLEMVIMATRIHKHRVDVQVVRADCACLDVIVVVPAGKPTPRSRTRRVNNVVLNIEADTATPIRAVYVGRDGIVIRMARYRAAGILALKPGCEASPVNDIAGPCDVGHSGTPVAAGITVIFNVERLLVSLSPEAIMSHVVVNDGSLYILHVNAIMRPAVALIALHQRTSLIAMDLDTVVAVAIADFVVQELRTVGIPAIVAIEELVVVAVIAVPCIVDV